MKQLLGAAVAVVLLAAALPLQASAAAGARTIDTHLANGMHVIIVPDALAPVVTTVISYGAGSDQESKPGEAHAVEHMMFRGTPVISASLLADIGARMGANYDANTTNESTNYYFTVPASYLNVILHIEADRMRNATVGEKDWDLERGAIEQEVRADESSPRFGLQQQIRGALYNGTPYVRDALGTVTSFNAMHAADLRSFYNIWYHPNNATLVIAGDVEPEKALAQVKAEFLSIPAVALPTRPVATLAPLKASAISATLDIPIGSVDSPFDFPAYSRPTTPPVRC
ncbi:MAG: insulinase family protein [Candidatus Eremiobacteraeota bacterium]|nr:insulinase family protein [Candidatus Eremiobacteraeota bacterium]